MKTQTSYRIKSGFLSAWMQQPPGTNSDMFLNQPEVASMLAAFEHIRFARKHGVQTIELAAAHSPRTANVPPESLADPVAHHVNMETNKDGKGGRDMSEQSIKELLEECQGEVTIGSFGAFENALSDNPVVRRQNLEHMRRAIRAAADMKKAGLGTEGVTIFVGRDLTKSVEENMKLFGKIIIPLIRYAKEHDVKIFIENCPMCGWSPTHEVFIQNIANSVMHWIMMAKMIEAANLRGWCFINYDPSHDILQGTRPEWSFKLLSRIGYGWIIGRFHGKDLSKQTGILAMATSLGNRIGNGWNKMNGDQPLPGATAHNPLAMANGLQVDWQGMLTSAILDLGMDLSQVTFTTEDEHGFIRNKQNFKTGTGEWDQQRHWDVAGQLLASSMGYIQGISEAAFHHASMCGQLNRICAPWSYQPLDPNAFEIFGIGSDAIYEQIEKWELPHLSETSELVLE